jgi:hypothetical protein
MCLQRWENVFYKRVLDLSLVSIFFWAFSTLSKKVNTFADYGDNNKHSSGIMIRPLIILPMSNKPGAENM